MLKLGRLDGVAISSPAYYNFLASQKGKNYKFADRLKLNTQYNYIYAHKSIDPKTLSLIKSTNIKLINSKLLDTILKKYK